MLKGPSPAGFRENRQAEKSVISAAGTASRFSEKHIKNQQAYRSYIAIM